MRQSKQKSSAFFVCWHDLEASMANSVDPDQTAPIGAACSGSTLFVSWLNLSVVFGNYLQQTTSADDIFRCISLALRGLRLLFTLNIQTHRFSWPLTGRKKCRSIIKCSADLKHGTSYGKLVWVCTVWLDQQVWIQRVDTPIFRLYALLYTLNRSYK